jgi:hypothetical protein
MDKLTNEEAIEIIRLVSEYGIVMGEIFEEISSYKQIPVEIGEAQCKVAFEMIRLITLIYKNSELEVNEDE